MNRGSVHQMRWPSQSQYGFNEAPIHESGKYFYMGLAVGCASVASMRPRFMNRGSRSCLRKAASIILRFNEAPIHESGK